MWIYLNDRFVREEKAFVSVFDHGFLYGDGAFETLRAYDGVFFSLREHLERLKDSARAIGLLLPALPFEDLLRNAMQKNSLHEAILRITLSRGPGPLSPSPRGCRSPTVVIFARPFHPPPRRWYARGLSAVLARTRRNPAEALDPRIKSANFLNLIMARREAERLGAQEAILLNTSGELAEGSTSNLFFVKGKNVYTPSRKAGILEGITRNVVLTLARENGIRLVEGCFRPAALRSADEAFLTNTSWEIAPLTRLDRAAIGTGRPGEVTRRLIRLFQVKVREEVRASSTARLNSVMLKGRSRGTRPERRMTSSESEWSGISPGAEKRRRSDRTGDSP
ncbi:MAG TPA: aminotransferase class IV [Nitrospiria bacterium]|nr:aminotransferase class IV [Nitrospiria bacterium]